MSEKLPPEGSYHWLQRKDGTIGWNYREPGSSPEWITKWADFWTLVEKPKPYTEETNAATAVFPEEEK